MSKKKQKNKIYMVKLRIKKSGWISINEEITAFTYLFNFCDCRDMEPQYFLNYVVSYYEGRGYKVSNVSLYEIAKYIPLSKPNEYRLK